LGRGLRATERPEPSVAHGDPVAAGASHRSGEARDRAKKLSEIWRFAEIIKKNGIRIE
jgi:hypothetical protein